MTELRRGPSGDFDREQGSSLLTENKPKENTEIPFCGCLSVRYYQPYFDVDTVDVTSRISGSLLYCRAEQNFLASVRERPDAYGPFWVCRCLIPLPCSASPLTWNGLRLLRYISDRNYVSLHAGGCIPFERLVVFMDEGRTMVGYYCGPA